MDSAQILISLVKPLWNNVFQLLRSNSNKDGWFLPVEEKVPVQCKPDLQPTL